MTYALAWPLQRAVYQRLTTDLSVSALVGTRVYDAPPPDAGPATTAYLTLGDETAKDWSTQTDHGAEHLTTITVHAPAEGFAEAKRIAAAVSDALLRDGLTLERGHVVCIGFRGAETKRAEDGRLRQITLRFRVLLEDTL